MNYIENEETERCLECGDSLEYGGRKGRKFCSEACKNSYHNKKAHDARHLHLHIISSLNKNYEILSKLIQIRIDKLDLSLLYQLGFNPSFITGYRKVKNHNEFSCFEFSYILTETKIYNLHKKKPPTSE